LRASGTTNDLVGIVFVNGRFEVALQGTDVAGWFNDPLPHQSCFVIAVFQQSHYFSAARRPYRRLTWFWIDHGMLFTP
jgi:hypothetical protein